MSNKKIQKIMTLVKLNLKTIKLAYVISGLVFLGFLAQTIVGYFVPEQNEELALSIADTLILIPVIAAILIPTRNFKKTMNLGTKRKDFLIGSIATYAVIAFIVSLVAVIFHLTIDNTVQTSFMASLINVFGWSDNNIVVAFLRYFSFVMFISAAIHALSFIQYKWTGWVADIIIIAIISVFTPIAVLRQSLVFFFDITIFTPSALLHIFVCLSLAAVLFVLNMLSINKKTI